MTLVWHWEFIISHLYAYTPIKFDHVPLKNVNNKVFTLNKGGIDAQRCITRQSFCWIIHVVIAIWMNYVMLKDKHLIISVYHTANSWIFYKEFVLSFILASLPKNIKHTWISVNNQRCPYNRFSMSVQQTNSSWKHLL